MANIKSGRPNKRLFPLSLLSLSLIFLFSLSFLPFPSLSSLLKSPKSQPPAPNKSPSIGPAAALSSFILATALLEAQV